ncbi:MAG: type IVB secretion system protein IcmH/DotU [Betaproteobacteria bacterium]
MAEESKKFDPEATVAQPAAALDPDATVNGPLVQPEPDPETTLTGPAIKKPIDPEATDRHPIFDPDATVNPAEKASLDPDATVRIPSPGRVRKNPFAPKSSTDTIQANLSALGGLNSLIAMANPILGAVPQIRRALKHPDPAGLRASLRDQIESLQTSAMSADVPDATVDIAVYALCALLDESAAATPWGASWSDNGLLKDMRGETGGGEGFFTRLDTLSLDQTPENTDAADLLEFYYVCLTLGFEGGYRKAEGGREALKQIRNDLYKVIARRRPRPDGLSEHWRSATAEAAAAPALQVAAKVTAQLSAQAAAAREDTTLPPVKPTFLSRLSRRVVWSGLAAVIGAMIVFYLLALRLLEDETKNLVASRPKPKAKVEQAAAKPAPAPVPSAPAPGVALAKALAGEPVTITDSPGGVALTLRHERQFVPGSTQPAPELRPLIQKIATALDKIPGTIVVTGHADASPTQRFASNSELAATRAQAVAQLMAPKLADPKRLSAVGKGESEPLAPSDTDANRAKNRRVTFLLKPAP